MNWRQVLSTNFRWDQRDLTRPVRMPAAALGSQEFKDLGVSGKVPPPPFLHPHSFPPQCLVSWVCLKRVIAPRFKIYSSSYSKSFVIKV